MTLHIQNYDHTLTPDSFNSLMDFVSNNPSLTAGDSFSGAGEPTADNNPILLPPKRPMGRPKGSKNKCKPPPLETRSLNPTSAVEVAAGKPTDTNRILRPRKKLVGRPKFSKNNREDTTVPPPLETRSLKSKAAGEPTETNRILRPQKGPLGRLKGSKNKREQTTVPPPLKTRSLNPMAGGEPTDTNCILQPRKRLVERPEVSNNKRKKAVPPHLETEPLKSTASESTDNNYIHRRIKLPAGRPINLNSVTIIEIPADANIIQCLNQFCCRHQVFITVLEASGELANIVPCHQPNLPTVAVPLPLRSLSGTVPSHLPNPSTSPGPFPILSLSGTVGPSPALLSLAENSREIIYPLTAIFSSPDGAALGGVVGKSATAAGTVKVVAVMTTELNHYTMSGTVHDDRANEKSNVEIAPDSTYRTASESSVQ